MAQARNRTRVGHVEPGELRRIGLRHAVVVMPVEARVVDVNAMRVELATLDRRLEAARKAMRQLEQRRTELSESITQFETMPIERIDGDPEVPQTAREVKPEPEPQDENPGV